MDAIVSINWRQLAHALYVALLAHRADMHGASSRPCATCHQSAVAIKAYDEAINEIARTNNEEAVRHLRGVIDEAAVAVGSMLPERLDSHNRQLHDRAMTLLMREAR
jgi:hypothetical protein